MKILFQTKLNSVHILYIEIHGYTKFLYKVLYIRTLLGSKSFPNVLKDLHNDLFIFQKAKPSVNAFGKLFINMEDKGLKRSNCYLALLITNPIYFIDCHIIIFQFVSPKLSYTMCVRSSFYYVHTVFTNSIVGTQLKFLMLQVICTNGKSMLNFNSTKVVVSRVHFTRVCYSIHCIRQMLSLW